MRITENEPHPIDSTDPQDRTIAMNIDLALAISYTPAVICLIRLSFYLFMYTLMKQGEEIGSFTILCLILWLDRVLFKIFLDSLSNLVFDSNALLMAIFFSHLVAFVRTSSSDPRVSFFSAIIFLWWLGSCLTLILEPIRLQKLFERKHRIYHAVPAVITIISLLALLRVRADPEEHGFTCIRAYTFAILSIAWIYIVGIHRFRSGESLRDNSSHFISRFAPVLYTPPALMVFFSIAAIVCIACQYYLTFVATEPAQKQPSQDAMERAQPSQPPKKDENYDQDDLEAMFRQAKMAKGVQ